MTPGAWRLRSHLAALLLATMGLNVAVIVVTGLLWRLPQLERDSQRQVRLHTHDVAARLELLLGARQSQLALLADALPGDDAARDGALLQDQVDAVADAGRAFQALYLLSPAGQVRALGLPQPDQGLAGRDLSGSALVRAVQAGGPLAWSADHPALQSGAATLGLAHRRADGQVLIGELPEGFAQALLHSVPGDPAAEVWVVDAAGTVLADAAQGRWVGQVLAADAPLLHPVRDGGVAPGEIVVDGRRYWAAAVPAAPLGWFVIGRTPAGLRHPAVRELLPHAASVLAACLLMGIGIAWLWARGMGRPLHDILARAARTTAGAAGGRRWPRGSVREFNAVSRDLEGMAAALQEREQKFHAIFNALPVPMVVTDADREGRAVHVNDAWCSALGYRREDVLQRTGVEMGLFTSQQHECMLAELREDGAAFEFEMRRSDGQAMQLRCSARRVRLPGAHWWILASVDVTPLRAIERELRELNQQLEQRVARRTQALTEANAHLAGKVEQLRLAQNELVQSEKLAALGALVAGVAHELNTPLGNGVMAVSAMADAAQRFRGAVQGGVRRADLRQLIDSMQQGIDIAQRNLRRAADLVHSFKQVAADQTTSRRRRFELAEVVHEMVVSLRPSFSRTPYRIETDVPETGLLLDSYPGALGQTIANLIQNAVLHGFDGRDHGTVRVSAGAGADGQVWLRVADDGRGIAPEHIGRIFEPFMTTKMGRGGTGLGLHISYNAVVNVLGGTLTVHSVPGESSCFMLRLPSEAPQSGLGPLERGE
ncbi:ATP-binding protein [Pseudorhodoferax sp. Leaf267]|uniref:ATP-binding protein n=1 Tax=Pseudorhodoferax sp. Leaf267 TaxID=1736316 RepID=UPI0006F2374B|nr:ATP-binding protein [Pseudorhodoferax sp. Leaf267]KQP17664.1 hypothetical protein ASF43_07185 [Pseudorhodoferax sp. Leaf267]